MGGDGGLRALVLVLAVVLMTGCGYSVAIIGPSPSPTASPIPSPSPVPTEPPNTTLQISPSPDYRTSTGATLFAGSILNQDRQWTATQIVVTVSVFDANGTLIQTFTSSLPDLGPSERQSYGITVPGNVKWELRGGSVQWRWRSSDRAVVGAVKNAPLLNK